jgi:hypothetical protein
MFESLKRLFQPEQQQESGGEERFAVFEEGASEVVRRYFELSFAIEQQKSDGNFAAAISAARQTYRLLPAFAEETPDAAMLRSHAVHTAPTLMAIVEDHEAIADLRQTLRQIPQLHAWLESADAAEADLKLVQSIMKEVATNPGVIQTSLKTRLGLPDGRRVGQLTGWLEKAERIRRVRKGSSYQLYLHGQLPEIAPAEGQPSAGRTLQPRTKSNRKAMAARMIDLSAIPIVRLPMAPPSWQEDRRQEKADPGSRATTPLFQTEGQGWETAGPEKLSVAERPDAAFKNAYHTSGSAFWVDPKGKTERFTTAASVLRVVDRGGAVVGERGLSHDTYRADVNADGSAVVFLSREGVLHAYSDDLSPLFAQWMVDLPEYRAQADRLGIPEREIKNHTRSVGISTDRSRYLVTVVDEAYCFDASSHTPLWVVRVPMQEGWNRVASERSGRVGTDQEVLNALQLMELELPVSPEEVTQQYRKLAMRWHPDRNPGDASSTARFQSLRQAFELLTGIDLEDLSPSETERISYERVLQHSTVSIPGGGTIDLSFSMAVSEKGAADWIYAANFASSGGGAYVATYSGKVIQLSEKGVPMRVYDSGSVPRHITDAGGYLYLLTDTRLYVLRENQLVALVDVFDQGHLIIGDTGFGLLDTKSFSWFSPAGARLGTIRSRDPIRRVMSTQQGLLVETRQHRIQVPAAQSWWRDVQ